MNRKLHPTEIRDAEIIANAVRYELALFLGRGKYAKAVAANTDEAAEAAARLSMQHPNGRLPLIYAIDAAGRSALVGYKPVPEEPMQKTYAKKFNAQRAAKAAGYELTAVDIYKTRGGYAFRPIQAKPEPAAAPAPRKPRGKRAAIEEAAREGILPEPPDFSAATHARFRGKLAKLVELAKAGDIDGLKAIEINPVSTSPKALLRYRDLCVTALEARQKG